MRSRRSAILLSIAPLLVLPALPAVAQKAPPGSHFVENWDLDSDGQVTLDEVTERRGDVFYTFDSNEDGVLDAEEYAMFDDARANDMADQKGHGAGAMVRAETGMHLDFNDIDGDGTVSQQEFLTKATDWFDMMDRDGDAVITTKDFGRG
ncbi:MAG: calcium-binding protein [Rhodobacteraceae bacterium]|nr:calcium-binding protein [Paracoccaceae bacterium]